MNKQVDVDILSDADDQSPVLARWFICDNGMTVAEGQARYHGEDGHVEWNGEAPPIEYVTDVIFEIDRAVKRRQERSGGDSA